MVIVAVLAAGRGTRMKSSLPKVLHPLGGRSLVGWVLHQVQSLQPQRQFVIIGYGGDAVRAALADQPQLEFVEQRQQLGTGHAVQQLLPYLKDYEGHLLVLNGDVPLLRGQTLAHLIEVHQKHNNAATILTAQIPNPQGYGRVICDSQNMLKQIIEDRDCTTAQKQNCRINAGVYCFHWPQLAAVLPHLQSNNDQQEYYLTDAVNALSPVMAVDVEDYEEILGVNDRVQLAAAYQVLQNRIKKAWMQAGVTLIDPASITIEDTVELAPDVVIEPQTHLRGQTRIGSGSIIGPGTLIENSVIGERVTARYAVITDSEIGEDTQVGPFAHIRQQSVVADHCRIGNFVELKKARLGSDTKASHLSYLGDATLGDRVNIGAGTITANYDGVRKHSTHIGSGTKTGANSVLVAPVTLGNNVTVAAGSTVTADVPDNALVIARCRQVVKPNWEPKA
ncbi:UDP-N-acetylglucosamine pyrophosphorylase [Thermostichus vulcanus NIES-2134]|nr:UDP-N-acetylglucosamine pyrophosphorylase [Thermostichus vulcanus NIES-2134]